ncbi:hypothetical protein A3735_06095 [Oleiphilus sp. HI0061]|uniref:SPOR domain-containing protein n=1 Tax=Oleiphilus sp. HI0061 TaxID=1822239 RepID=UPI0007CF60C9|nr:SPOR domain-containing protein [Oleiphilus sp. HI0061]KZY52459.1 hypothetical protein A3735_06095 [Oleiphilus sp. HI0061]
MRNLILYALASLTMLLCLPSASLAEQTSSHLGKLSFKKESSPGHYWIQLNASKSKQNAIRSIQNKPSIKSAHLYKDTNSLYHVITGPYPTRFDAIRKLNKVRKAGFKDAFVRFTKTNQLAAHSIWLTRSKGSLIEKESLTKQTTSLVKVKPEVMTKGPEPSGEISIESWNKFIAEHHGAERIKAIDIESSKVNLDKGKLQTYKININLKQ